jgi:hypothetical protein
MLQLCFEKRIKVLLLSLITDILFYTRAIRNNPTFPFLRIRVLDNFHSGTLKLPHKYHFTIRSNVSVCITFFLNDNYGEWILLKCNKE